MITKKRVFLFLAGSSLLLIHSLSAVCVGEAINRGYSRSPGCGESYAVDFVCRRPELFTGTFAKPAETCAGRFSSFLTDALEGRKVSQLTVMEKCAAGLPLAGFAVHGVDFLFADTQQGSEQVSPFWLAGEHRLLGGQPHRERWQNAGGEHNGFLAAGSSVRTTWDGWGVDF